MASMSRVFELSGRFPPWLWILYGGLFNCVFTEELAFLHSPLQKLLGSFMSIQSPSTGTSSKKADICKEYQTFKPQYAIFCMYESVSSEEKAKYEAIRFFGPFLPSNIPSNLLQVQLMLCWRFVLYQRVLGGGSTAATHLFLPVIHSLRVGEIWICCGVRPHPANKHFTISIL